VLRKPRGVYPPDWPEIAARVKEEAGWRCVRCGHPHDPPAGYSLTVHHLDLDKANCEWWNIPSLCQRCHLKVQATLDIASHDVQTSFWGATGWLIPYLEGRRQALAIKQEVAT